MRGRRTLLCGMLAVMVACGSEDPAAELRSLIDRAELSAEERDTGFFRDVLSQRYADRRGNDRDRLVAILRGYFLTHQSIEIVTRVDSVVLSGADAAEIVLYAGMLGRRDGASPVAGLAGQLYRIELELVEQGGDWQVIGADWERSLE